MLVAILHNIRSLHNVGSIFRTADGAGVSKIFLTGFTPQPIDRFGNPRPQLAKVSLGAEKTVPWEYSRSIASVIKKLKKEKFLIFALEQSSHSIPYNAIPHRYHIRRSSNVIVKRIALIVGNEIDGLPATVLKQTDAILEIPMRGKTLRWVRQAHRRQAQGKESLNVSVAFGIAAYEINQLTVESE